jgi:Spy/CpxP family protein refolding chaperone
MTKKTWLHTAAILALLRAFTLGAHAQEPTAVSAIGEQPAAHSRTMRGGSPFGFESRLSKAVGLTPEQRDAVKGLMAQQRQQRSAIQEQTDTKIRAILNPDQLKKFDTFLADQKKFHVSRSKKSS